MEPQKTSTSRLYNLPLAGRELYDNFETGNTS
jgi:hypothetical protein